MALISSTYHAWRGDKGAKAYENVKGFCHSATTAEISSHGYLLTPGRFVGSEEAEVDGETFELKMPRLVKELNSLFKKSKQLEIHIGQNLKGLGYEY